jgi:hypothetical protein
MVEPHRPLCPVDCSFWPPWPVPRCSSQLLLHCPGRLTESIRRLAGAGGWTMPSVRPCSLQPECSPPAADLGGILRGLCDAIWLYLVAALVLAAPPRILGSCRRSRSPPVGIGFGVALWRGPEREEAGTPRRAQPYRTADTWSNSRCDSPIGPEALIITNSASGIRSRTSVTRSWAPDASMIRSGRLYPRSAVDYYHAVIFIRGLTG